MTCFHVKSVKRVYYSADKSNGLGIRLDSRSLITNRIGKKLSLLTKNKESRVELPFKEIGFVFLT